MIKFLAGLIFGVIIGAAAMFFISALGGRSGVAVAPPAVGQAVIHVSIDQSYLNQQLTRALATQPQFKGVKPTLTLQGPNAVIVSVDIQANVNGTLVKVHPVVTMQLLVENGRIHTNVASVNIGALNVPLEPFQAQINQLNRMMEEQANSAVANGLAGTGLKIVNVTTTNNSLSVDLGE